MRLSKLVSAGLAALLISGAFAAGAQAEAGPANDDKANATLVDAVPYTVAVDTSSATTESGETSQCDEMGNSVWWRLSLPSDADIIVKTAGSDFDTMIDVYRETPAGEVPVGCNDQYHGNTSRFEFAAAAGESYLVQVSGWYGDYGNLRLNIHTNEPLGNDNFAAAYPLTGNDFSVDASTAGATTESGEPIPCDRLLIARTVWFRWTPAESARLWLDAYSRVIGIYSGSALDNLVSAGCGQGWSGTDVTGGQTYYIQVGVNDLGANGAFTLDGHAEIIPPAPANDDLANAETISGLGEFHSGNTSSATTEPNEYTCADSYMTLWYKFTATKDGPLVATSEGSQIDTTVAVFTGTSYDDLSEVACNDEAAGTSTSRTGFAAQAGQTYLIQVGDYFGDGGVARIGLLEGYATGDSVANATVTTDDQGVHEVGVGVNGFLAGAGAGTSGGEGQRETYVWADGFLVWGGAWVADDPEGGHYVEACAGALIGTCFGTWTP